MTDEPFRFPGSSYRELIKKIKCFGNCVLLLCAGCTSTLPYDVSIDTVQIPSACVLPLSDIVELVAHGLPPGNLASRRSSLRALQREFELALELAEVELGVASHPPELNLGPNSEDQRLQDQVQILMKGRRCASLPEQPTGAKLKNILRATDSPAEFNVRSMASKWMVSYAADPSDSDHSLERFTEFLQSSEIASILSITPMHPDARLKETELLVERPSERHSQWCGTRQKNSPGDRIPARCDSAALYKMIPQPADLYTAVLPSLIREIDTATQPDQRRNHRIIMLSYEIPWDADRTRVRYGVTFYFEDKQVVTAEDTKLIGYDLLYANEATPQPVAVNISSPSLIEDGNAPAGKKSFWGGAWNLTGYPFVGVIALKNVVFEVAKLPFSFVEGLLFGRDSINYPVQNVLNARDTLIVELSSLPRGGMETGLYRLITEIPLVGQIFQYNFGGNFSEPDNLPTQPRRKIFLSRGIFGGNKWGQDTGLWVGLTSRLYPSYDVDAVPYRHGSVIDVIWSMFNLSHGPGYSEARYIMDHAATVDRLYLAGHSGGVQRSASASRILFHHNYRVIKVVGIAGPSIGQAYVDPRYPDAFRQYLTRGEGANADVVSKVGLVAGTFSTLLTDVIIAPVKYTVGLFCFTDSRCRDAVYFHADMIGYSNARTTEVLRSPSSQHQTPLRLSLGERHVFDAYLRSEFSTAFREDLERPMRPNRTDRPGAFDWKR